MERIRDRHAKESEIASGAKPRPIFESVTQKFLSSPQSKRIQCPTCGTMIDFNSGVEWQGPDTFACNGCERLLSMRLIHRALRDLGIE